MGGGAGQPEPAGDLGGGERAVPLEEELQNVERPGHRGYESSHGPHLTLMLFEMPYPDRNSGQRLAPDRGWGNGPRARAIP
ncbi:hypothetical protein GCM10017562_63880 [Streptomyces roseofulvus]